MKVAIEGGIFGGNPRTWHGKNVGYLEVEETETLQQIYEKIKEKGFFNQPFRVERFENLQKTAREFGLVEGSALHCIFIGKSD